jgi:hypothetical protein
MYYGTFPTFVKYLKRLRTSSLLIAAAWCLDAFKILITSISRAYIIEISMSYIKPLVKLVLAKVSQNRTPYIYASLLWNHYVKMLKEGTIFIYSLSKRVTNVISEMGHVKTHILDIGSNKTCLLGLGMCIKDMSQQNAHVMYPSFYRWYHSRV